MSDNHEVVDWDDLSEEDRENAMMFLRELNKIMDKYTKDVEEKDNASD